MSESNIELARRGYAAAARGDFGEIAELLDPEVKWHGGDPSASGACRNRTEALQFMRAAWSRQGDRPGS
jgi:ketosteroid isomerase-like protein